MPSSNSANTQNRQFLQFTRNHFAHKSQKPMLLWKELMLHWNSAWHAIPAEPSSLSKPQSRKRKLLGTMTIMELEARCNRCLDEGKFLTDSVTEQKRSVMRWIFLVWIRSHLQLRLERVCRMMESGWDFSLNGSWWMTACCACSLPNWISKISLNFLR